MAVSVRRRRPRHFPSPEGKGGLEEPHAANFLVLLGTELGPDQVPFVRVKQYGVTVRSQVDARPALQVCDLCCFPNLLAGARLQADQFARRFGGVQIVAPEQCGRGMAQDSSSGSFRGGPEYGG